MELNSLPQLVHPRLCRCAPNDILNKTCPILNNSPVILQNLATLSEGGIEVTNELLGFSLQTVTIQRLIFAQLNGPLKGHEQPS